LCLIVNFQPDESIQQNIIGYIIVCILECITYLFHDVPARANMGLRAVRSRFSGSGLWYVISFQSQCWVIGDESRSWNNFAFSNALCKQYSSKWLENWHAE